jgi:hypothetical protein
MCFTELVSREISGDSRNFGTLILERRQESSIIAVATPFSGPHSYFMDVRTIQRLSKEKANHKICFEASCSTSKQTSEVLKAKTMYLRFG